MSPVGGHICGGGSSTSCLAASLPVRDSCSRWFIGRQPSLTLKCSSESPASDCCAHGWRIALRVLIANRAVLHGSFACPSSRQGSPVRVLPRPARLLRGEGARQWEGDPADVRDGVEVMGDVVMSRPIVRRAVPAYVAVAASVLLLASCSQDSDEHSAARSTPPPQATAHAPASSSTPDRALLRRATSVMASVAGGVLVEGGSERVGDGIHTRPVLKKGKTYRLVLTCVGRGSAHLTVAPTTSGSDATVPCDQSVVQQRINGSGAVRIDVVGAERSRGGLAWRIVTL